MKSSPLFSYFNYFQKVNSSLGSKRAMFLTCKFHSDCSAGAARLPGIANFHVEKGFSSSSPTKRLLRKKSSGLTLIELLISIIILMLFFHTLFFLGAKVYGYAGKVRKTTEIKSESMRAFALMEKDLKSAERVIILPENSGITIYRAEGESVSWYGKDDSLMRKEKDRAVSILQIPVSDVIWTDNGDILSLSLTFTYNNINGKIITEKILHNFEVK